MKTKITALAFSILALNIHAAEIFDTATIVSATPITQKNPPRRVCQQAQEQQSGGVNAGGIVGGIAGAILGSQVGKGNGKVAGAAVGAATGALVGNNLGSGNSNAGSNGSGQVCNMVDDGTVRITGYDVIYEYNGHQGRTRTYSNPSNPTAYQPGQSIRVGISAL